MSSKAKKAVVSYLRSHTFEQAADRFDLSIGKIYSIAVEEGNL